MSFGERGGARVVPFVRHVTAQYANNRAEVSHQPTRQRERLLGRS
jgi:transposase-like protein